MLAQEPIHIASVAVSEPVDSMQTQSLEVDDSSDQGPVSRNTGSDKSRNVRQDWESLFRSGWWIFSTWLEAHQQARQIGAAEDFESKHLKAKAMRSWTENTQFTPPLVSSSSEDSESSDEASESSDGEYRQARIPESWGQVHIPGHWILVPPDHNSDEDASTDCDHRRPRPRRTATFVTGLPSTTTIEEAQAQVTAGNLPRRPVDPVAPRRLLVHNGKNDDIHNGQS